MTHQPDDKPIRPVLWRNDGLELIDQQQLPATRACLRVDNVADTARAITDMVVRGAPAIGITAAFGVVLAARAAWRSDPDHWRELVEPDLQLLALARPTAVNLVWAIERMREQFAAIEGDPEAPLLAVAEEILAADIAANKVMGALGANLLEPDSRVMTHCNAGALATGGYGTALGVIRAGVHSGVIAEVYAGETRPWLQGARLTAWELAEDDIPVTLITDSAAPWMMQQGRLDWVIVGADRIAANGDVANKIGTYGLAVAARHHGVKLMVVAPTSTVDMAIAEGADIPIETRQDEEILAIAGQRMAPAQAIAENPAFDVTPASLITVIVTELGIVTDPATTGMAPVMHQAHSG